MPEGLDKSELGATAVSEDLHCPLAPRNRCCTEVATGAKQKLLQQLRLRCPKAETACFDFPSPASILLSSNFSISVWWE